MKEIMTKLYAKHVLILKTNIWDGKCQYLYFENEVLEVYIT